MGRAANSNARLLLYLSEWTAGILGIMASHSAPADPPPAAVALRKRGLRRVI
jgi:hypothetical protein